jgi:hypothetical protein
MLNPIYLSAALGLLGIAITNGQNSIWCLSVRFFPFRERIPLGPIDKHGPKPNLLKLSNL